jgi:outer membrane immunogenic protein
LGRERRLQLGPSQGRGELARVGTFSESQKVDGVVGGFQSGYNYQFGQWVLGFETDIQASGQKGGTTLQSRRFRSRL